MHPRRVQLLLRVLSLALVAGGAVVVAWIWVQTTSVDTDIVLSVPSTRPATRVAAGLPALPEYEPLWARRLRPSLDPTTAGRSSENASASGAPAVQTSAGISLVGTIGNSIALVRDTSGNVEAHQVGETIAGGGEVVAVRPSEMDLRVNGQVVTLKRIADAPDTTPAAVTVPPEGDPALGRLAEGE